MYQTGSKAHEIRYTINVFENYIHGKPMYIDLMTSAQLNENLLFDNQIYILDVRPQFLRKKLKSLPNSHEVSFFFIEKYLHQLPKNKSIVVICQHGNLSFIIAYYLKSKGFEHVSSLQGGVEGWKKLHENLYQKYAGQNVTVFQY